MVFMGQKSGLVSTAVAGLSLSAHNPYSSGKYVLKHGICVLKNYNVLVYKDNVGNCAF